MREAYSFHLSHTNEPRTSDAGDADTEAAFDNVFHPLCFITKPRKFITKFYLIRKCNVVYVCETIDVPTPDLCKKMIVLGPACNAGDRARSY